MGADTKIQWATHTFNHVRGCAKIAPGCANCYAERLSRRNPGTLGAWGPSGARVVAAEAMWREPIKWDKAAACLQTFDCANGDHADCCSQKSRPRVFCASLADVFERWGGEIRGSSGGVMWDAPGVPWQEQMLPGRTDGIMRDGGGRRLTLDDVRARLFATIDATPNLDWLLLTKRPENVRRMWVPYGPNAADGEMDEWRSNVWLGVSIACRADLRLLDELRKCRDLCAKTFVSAEPLLEDLGTIDLTGIDWVIIGGESGPNARSCNVDDVRSIVRQCRAAHVPPFVKQVGARVIDMDVNSGEAFADEVCWPEGTKTDGCRVLLRDKKGGDPAEWPEDLRVREVPT